MPFEIIESCLQDTTSHSVLTIHLGGIQCFDNQPTRIFVKAYSDERLLLSTTWSELDLPLPDALTRHARHAISIARSDKLLHKPNERIDFIVHDPTAFLLLTNQAGYWRKMQKRWYDDFRRITRKCPAPVRVSLGTNEMNQELKDWLDARPESKASPTSEQNGKAHHDWYLTVCKQRGW